LLTLFSPPPHLTSLIHSATPSGNYKLASSEQKNPPLEEEGEVVRPLPFIRHSRFLTTSRTIRLFGAGVTVRFYVEIVGLFSM